MSQDIRSYFAAIWESQENKNERKEEEKAPF